MRCALCPQGCITDASSKHSAASLTRIALLQVIQHETIEDVLENDNSCGADLLEARILRVSGNDVEVEYRSAGSTPDTHRRPATRSTADGCLHEDVDIVPRADVRPLPPPPPAAFFTGLRVGDKVDYLSHGGWWEATIKKRYTNDKLGVCYHALAPDGTRRFRVAVSRLLCLDER